MLKALREQNRIIKGRINIGGGGGGSSRAPRGKRNEDMSMLESIVLDIDKSAKITKKELMGSYQRTEVRIYSTKAKELYYALDDVDFDVSQNGKTVTAIV